MNTETLRENLVFTVAHSLGCPVPSVAPFPRLPHSLGCPIPSVARKSYRLFARATLLAWHHPFANAGVIVIAHPSSQQRTLHPNCRDEDYNVTGD
ncbi:MAG: hypothetical protein P1U77_17790 [Rubripirellula sp.]|nr:hypothetical protein [Rubripirellula sp.]